MKKHDYTVSDYKPGMGKRIRACREQSNLTQENMAEILNVSVKHYSEVERGLTGLAVEKLLFLSSLFNVSLDYLLKGDGEPTSIPFVLTEAYRSCPEEKKEYFIGLAKNLNYLLRENGSKQEEDGSQNG